MTQVLYGERLGREGEVRVGCSAAIFDETREKVLLTRRTDNGLWCLPGGLLEPGESVAEACAREVREETGLEVAVRRLVGVYSDPDQLVVYPDGNKAFLVVLHFEAEILSGVPGLSDETVEVGYYRLEALERLAFLGHHRERIFDALPKGRSAVIR